MLRGWRLVPPLASTAYRIGPRSNDAQAVAGRLGRAIDAMTGAVDHVLCLVERPAMDAPGVAVRAADVEVTHLLEPLLRLSR
jgi:hypothetical protein